MEQMKIRWNPTKLNEEHLIRLDHWTNFSSKNWRSFKACVPLNWSDGIHIDRFDFFSWIRYSTWLLRWFRRASTMRSNSVTSDVESWSLALERSELRWFEFRSDRRDESDFLDFFRFWSFSSSFSSSSSVNRLLLLLDARERSWVRFDRRWFFVGVEERARFNGWLARVIDVRETLFFFSSSASNARIRSWQFVTWLSGSQVFSEVG